MKGQYIEKIYAGLLGKLIGIRYGAPIEGWTYENIKKTYGKLDGYIVDYKDFAADDDSNGPIFFIRALTDYTFKRDITPEQIGYTWLNYAPYEHGFYWWGGYGVSSEHTAYLNLRNGINAPLSGSIEQNGETLAEQIGGQIFIDTWGLVTPGNPELACEYAKKAASVAHDRNGVYGGIFVASCISAAFIEKDIHNIINIGLNQIPKVSEYYRVVKEIIKFHNENPENWELAYNYIFNNFGYDKYPGICHIIPNTAVMILAMLYGNGDFTKTLNICNMCGWDTDCNVANVGTILGVLNGLEGIDYNKWRKSINDRIVCSSVIGSLNIVDIPSFVYYLADLAYKISDQEPEEKYKDSINNNIYRYNFSLPGSTHGIKVRSNNKYGTLEYTITNDAEVFKTYGHSLKVVSKPLNALDEMYIYQKTYYTPNDLHDNRYEPAFSPIIYPGQSVKATFKSMYQGIDIKAFLYVKDRNTGCIHYSDGILITDDNWVTIDYKIPKLNNACIEEVGICLKPYSEVNMFSNITVYLDEIKYYGKADYNIEFSNINIEKWSDIQQEICGCTRLKGYWDLTDNGLSGTAYDFAELYTGNYYCKDCKVEVELTPIRGNGHCLNFRVQGAIRSYAVGLFDKNKLILLKNDNGYEPLAVVDYPWEYKTTYRLTVNVINNRIVVTSEEKTLIDYIDTNKPYMNGTVGVSILDKGHCCFSYIKVREA